MCDEYIARAILGAWIGRAQSDISCMLKKASFADSTTAKLEEADRFFIEYSDEILCCPYIPASDDDVLRLRPLIVGTSEMVQSMRDRFSVRSGRVYDKDKESYTTNTEGQRVKDLISGGKAWYRPFRAYYPRMELFGLEPCRYTNTGLCGSGVRLALPVYKRGPEDGRHKRRVVCSQARPADSAPLMAAYAAWLYKEAGLARPNRPITAIRPDRELIQSIIESALAKKK